MTFKARLVVTGREPDGTSVLLRDEPSHPITIGASPGSEFYLLWGTDDCVATVGTQPSEPRIFPFFPGPGGTRVMFARYAPQSAVPEPVGDPDELSAEAEEKLPGLMGVSDPDDPRMHASDSVDYGVCMEGELVLELDNGKEVVLTPGTCVVQQGTRHAWHNRGDTPALMCFVIIGADRDS